MLQATTMNWVQIFLVLLAISGAGMAVFVLNMAREKAAHRQSSALRRAR